MKPKRTALQIIMSLSCSETISYMCVNFRYNELNHCHVMWLQCFNYWLLIWSLQKNSFNSAVIILLHCKTQKTEKNNTFFFKPIIIDIWTYMIWVDRPLDFLHFLLLLFTRRSTAVHGKLTPNWPPLKWFFLKKNFFFFFSLQM